MFAVCLSPISYQPPWCTQLLHQPSTSGGRDMRPVTDKCFHPFLFYFIPTFNARNNDKQSIIYSSSFFKHMLRNVPRREILFRVIRPWLTFCYADFRIRILSSSVYTLKILLSHGSAKPCTLTLLLLHLSPHSHSFFFLQQ